MSNRQARILVIDDNPAIHEDFRKILVDKPAGVLEDLEAELFGARRRPEMPRCQMESAYQGKEACELVQARLAEGVRFTTVFVDMRMPPGWDGVQTIEKLWTIDPELEVVVCTAYSDYTWEELGERFGSVDRLLILKKPFDPIEVRQLASALTEKWFLSREAQLKLGQLEQMVADKTQQLQQQVSELSTLQSQLSESTSLMRTFFDSSPFYLSLLTLEDEDVKVLMYNAAFGKVSASLTAAPTVVSMRATYPTHLDIWLGRLRQVRETGQPCHFEDSYPIQPKTLSMAFTVAPVAGSNDRFCVFGENISERRAMESMLRLQERMASIGTLAAGVAHEINNPLAFVAGNLDYLNERLHELPRGSIGDLAEVMAEMRDGTDRVRRIVRDLKVFSRVEEERLEPLDVSRLCDSSINMLAHELRNRATVVRHYEDVGRVPGNPTRLGQVFLNLLANASQAVPEGEADRHRITVSVRREALEVVVEVSDTGCGIPPEIQGRIFDPFFTTKALGSGTGLGLSICHHIIHEAGGSISVKSELGRGTTFSVRLPAPLGDARPVEAPPAAPPPPPVAVKPAPPPGASRILVIDDEPQVSQVVSRMLRRHECVLVSSAKEALARLSERFDLIICDLMMPVMTGMQLYQLLLDQHPQMAEKVIFVTGGAFTAESQEFAEQFPERVLEKPLDVERLRRIVDGVLHPQALLNA